MKQYRFVVKEMHLQGHILNGNNLAEAMESYEEGEGEIIPNDLEYYYTDESGMKVGDLPEDLRAELPDMKDDDILYGIESIEVVKSFSV